jgi:hypothetical protein
VLLTNHELSLRGGSQLYVRDVARGLLDLGHQPVAYSPRLGACAEQIRDEGVPVVDDLARVSEPPDLIHGQHNLPAMTAMLHFPSVPAVFFCHGWLPWEEAPLRFPRILRWVAVDRLRRERLVSESGIDPSRVELVPNFVDLRRIDRRAEPLPRRPRRALLFSNQASVERGFGRAVLEACARRGLSLEMLGLASGTSSARPGEVLHRYDLVFARGRSAMEAMAAGAAVVLCDQEGLGPAVDGGNVGDLLGLNFGLAALCEPVTSERVGERIEHYDPAGAGAAGTWIRSHCGLGPAMDRLVTVYERVLAEWETSPRADPALERWALAEYMAFLSRRRTEEQATLGAVHVRMSEMAGERRDERAREQDHVERLAAEVTSLQEGLEALRDELGVLEASRALRARRWLVSRPLLSRLYRLLAGRRTADG